MICLYAPWNLEHKRHLSCSLHIARSRWLFRLVTETYQAVIRLTHVNGECYLYTRFQFKQKIVIAQFIAPCACILLCFQCNQLRNYWYYEFTHAMDCAITGIMSSSRNKLRNYGYYELTRAMNCAMRMYYSIFLMQ